MWNPGLDGKCSTAHAWALAGPRSSQRFLSAADLANDLVRQAKDGLPPTLVSLRLREWQADDPDAWPTEDFLQPLLAALEDSVPSPYASPSELPITGRAGVLCRVLGALATVDPDRRPAGAYRRWLLDLPVRLGDMLVVAAADATDADELDWDALLDLLGAVIDVFGGREIAHDDLLDLLASFAPLAFVVEPRVLGGLVQRTELTVGAATLRAVAPDALRAFAQAEGMASESLGYFAWALGESFARSTGEDSDADDSPMAGPPRPDFAPFLHVARTLPTEALGRLGAGLGAAFRQSGHAVGRAAALLGAWARLPLPKDGALDLAVLACGLRVGLGPRPAPGASRTADDPLVQALGTELPGGDAGVIGKCWVMLGLSLADDPWAALDRQDMSAAERKRWLAAVLAVPGCLSALRARRESDGKSASGIQDMVGPHLEPSAVSFVARKESKGD